MPKIYQDCTISRKPLSNPLQKELRPGLEEQASRRIKKQQLSKDLTDIYTSHLRGKVSIAIDGSTSNPSDIVEGKMTAEFKERYRQGFTLKPMHTPDTENFPHSASN
ncbi:hypothetical protein N7481_013348 [Penicillium waksmanii]|uniref:uncharacterized protein n=1 Tax=Penicillium waksmanii TaxID=69791 RepID=UPI002548F665|nr:uncharacterized protein N7481_013348 [Penicillium waksmanii]KAJ5966634.1 hypothetical protein N7481_013348 [Penicillium waksmanii]